MKITTLMKISAVTSYALLYCVGCGTTRVIQGSWKYVDSDRPDGLRTSLELDLRPRDVYVFRYSRRSIDYPNLNVSGEETGSWERKNDILSFTGGILKKAAVRVAQSDIIVSDIFPGPQWTQQVYLLRRE